MFKDAKYIISATNKTHYPNKQNLKEYVILGRSNVGKSSFINALTNRKNLAKISQKPGKTITINFYLIDNSFYLVDVPGYGYAMRSVEERLRYGKYIEEYLHRNPNLQRAFLLVDARHSPTEDDCLMYNYLKYLQIPTTIIGTKSDKIGKTKLISHEKEIRNKLNIQPGDDLILVSSFTKFGIDKVYQYFGY